MLHISMKAVRVSANGACAHARHMQPYRAGTITQYPRILHPRIVRQQSQASCLDACQLGATDRITGRAITGGAPCRPVAIVGGRNRWRWSVVADLQVPELSFDCRHRACWHFEPVDPVQRTLRNQEVAQCLPQRPSNQPRHTSNHALASSQSGRSKTPTAIRPVRLCIQWQQKAKPLCWLDNHGHANTPSPLECASFTRA